MNKKAEKFKEFLKEKKIEAFKEEEIKEDELNTAVFRSSIDVDGNRLPVIVILDSSIYGMVRVLVAPKAVKEENEQAVLQLVNKYNKTYKSLKYYVDDEKSLVMDTCILFKEGKADGDIIYAMIDLIIQQLGEAYKEIMKSIWN